jgi:environmental stress-induced protein Ves
MQLLLARDRPAQPWKNGQGVTWQVAASPVGAGLDDFDWRISIAEISQDGPFSAFAGIDRAIAVIEGTGVTLTVDGVDHALLPYQPMEFPGEAETSCRLVGGTTRDLNLMTVRDRARGSIEFVTVTGEVQVVARALIVVSGNAQVSSGDEGADLGAFDAVVLDRPVSVVAEHAIVAVIRVQIVLLQEIGS